MVRGRSPAAFEQSFWQRSRWRRAGETVEVKASTELGQSGMMVVRVRRAAVGDAVAIAVVHVRAWQAAYQGLLPQAYLDGLDPGQRREGWERILAETAWPQPATLLAEDAEGVVGFTRLCPTRDQDGDPAMVGEITCIYLLPAVWGTGIGRQLMQQSLMVLGEAGYQQATLWVLDTNERARRFYEAGG
jgi:ribosomal protein S18 acetylase RimI-like enzyme